jgi:hypothetical protein
MDQEAVWVSPTRSTDMTTTRTLMVRIPTACFVKIPIRVGGPIRQSNEFSDCFDG